jgi:uncharacterized membrane protein
LRANFRGEARLRYKNMQYNTKLIKIFFFLAKFSDGSTKCWLLEVILTVTVFVAFIPFAAFILFLGVIQAKICDVCAY